MAHGGKGSVTLPERRVQSFLYLLLRDYLPSGDVELLFEMLRETDYDGDIIYSCPHIEALSGDMARRLLGTGSGMSDNEVGQHADRKEDNEEDSLSKEGGSFDYSGGFPKASVLDARVKVATGEGYPESNEDDARVREAEEDDYEEERKRKRVISNEIEEGFSSEGYDAQGFNAKGIDAQGYNREGIFVQKQEDGGFLTSSGFPITEEEIIAQCLEGENKATRIEDDDLGFDFLAKDRSNLKDEGDGSGRTGSKASKGATEDKGETES